MDANKLKAEAQELRHKAQSILSAADALDRDPTDQEVEKIESLTAEAKGIDEKIARAEAIAQTRADLERDIQAGEEVAQPRTRQVGRVDVGASERDKILADPKAGHKTRAEFFHNVLKASISGKVDARLSHLRVGAAAGSDEHGTFDDARGGFLLPEGFREELLTVAPEADPTVGRTTMIPMQTQVVNIPARVDKNHSTSVTGGLRVYRRAEADSVSASRMELEQVKLEAQSLMGLSYSTEELLSDSPISVAALISNGFNTEMASKLLDEKINGTGVGEYQGVLKSSALISVTRTTSSEIKGADIINMRKRAWRYGQQYIWLANHDAYGELVDAHISGTNDDTFLFRPGNGVDVPDTILGRPVFFTEYVPGLGSKGDLILANFSEYLEGMLSGPDFSESIHVRFIEHERAFKVVSRNAGASWWRSALTPKKGANTLSPFITIAA